MTDVVANEIAELINTQNQLTKRYSGSTVLASAGNYLVRMHAGSVIGVVEIKKVQWYQCEVLHLSVAPSAQGKGIGRGLVEEAEDRARTLGARIAQCTIRVGNAASEAVFAKRGFTETTRFHNAGTGNDVGVYQKIL